jgi:hypothetical protein
MGRRRQKVGLYAANRDWQTPSERKYMNKKHPECKRLGVCSICYPWVEPRNQGTYITKPHSVKREEQRARQSLRDWYRDAS